MQFVFGSNDQKLFAPTPNGFSFKMGQIGISLSEMRVNIKINKNVIMINVTE